MSKTYTLERIADLLQVPSDRREACVQEIMLGLELLDLAAGDETPPILEGPMTWTDDGTKNINLTMGDDSLTLAVTEACWCTTCRPITLKDMRFVVCPECGNKRCPRAHNHQLECTDSNAPGQSGSSWEHVKPVQWCDHCGEGVTTFCRGKTDNRPRGLPLPGTEQA